MARPKRRCYFCEREGKLTVEHVFSKKWLERLLPGVPGFVNQTTTRETPHEPFREWTWKRPIGKGGGMEVKSVCRNCNSRWMQRLDNDTKPLLWPLCFAQAGEVAFPEGNHRLAQWATKIALVIDSMFETHMIPQEWRTQFMHDREPLAASRLWIGAMARTDVEVRQLGLILGPYEAPEDPKLYVATFRVLHAIFQVVIPVADGIQVIRAPEIPVRARRLWPPQEVIDWPPPRGDWIRNEDEFWALGAAFAARLID